MTSSFDCSCRPSHLLGRSEGRKGNDVQSLKDSLFPTFTVEGITLCVYCYPLLFLGFKTLILKNPRGDWSTKSITKNVTATGGKKADNFCLSNSIKINDGDCTLKKYPISILFFGPCIFNNEDKNKPTKCTN